MPNVLRKARNLLAALWHRAIDPGTWRVRVIRLRLRASEWLQPRLYFTQMKPVYAGEAWERDRRDYERLHDWPHMRDGNRVLQADVLLERVRDLPAGDYAELGTFRGNYARLIFPRMAANTRLYCFDTFEGFDQRDLDAETAQTSATPSSAGHFADTSLETVVRNITRGESSERLVIRQGFFPQTFAGLENHRWRFVLLDADLYAPIRAGLEAFWQRLVPGGILLVHDYLSRHYVGSREAVDGFFEPLGLYPVPWPDYVGSAVITKPRG